MYTYIPEGRHSGHIFLGNTGLHCNDRCLERLLEGFYTANTEYLMYKLTCPAPAPATTIKATISAMLHFVVARVIPHARVKMTYPQLIIFCPIRMSGLNWS